MSRLCMRPYHSGLLRC